MQRLEFRAMGCQMLAVLDAAGEQAARRLALTPDWFEEWERILSRFRQDSELNGLNHNSGRWMPVSAVLWEVIQAALEAARTSRGLVVPTLLAALEAAGYDRTFEAVASSGRPAPAAPPPSPGSNTDWRAIRCDSRTRSIFLPAGMRLDLGGIAKGWAADQAARRLGAYGPALVDAGGDIAVSAPQSDGQPWPIGVATPMTLLPGRRQASARREGEGQGGGVGAGHTLPLLMLHRGGVATSGRDYRRWRCDGVWQHHILDPRTGRPAKTDVLSATVVAPDACEAEAAAKAALILGSSEGLAWLDAHPSLAGLLVLEDGRVRCSRRLERYLWSP